MDLLWGSTWCLLSAWRQRADFRPVLTQTKASQEGSLIWPLQPVECGKKTKKNKSGEFAGREWPFHAPSSPILRLCVRVCELREGCASAGFTVYSRSNDYNVFLIVQDVLISSVCVTAPLFAHQKEARAQAQPRHPQTHKQSRERAER